MADAKNPSPSEEPGFDLGGARAAEGPAASYRVLARKYRPGTFDDLIGQEAMVRTISNAFETGRIPQAWILTGVRGVGKTTTARILARALNYELPDGSITGPTIKMPALGVHDQAIMESRHIDVLEMDAASHNSVDDVRQINDAVRYAPVSARYKVYILDEVHMLSPQAFNALLKTLEEPPPHAKFIFATTEIRKVPVTILSRCQRFDLRRVDAAMLVQHLQNIAAKEKIEAEPEALALIARAADGSVRDSLSLFDQAIAHAAGIVRAEDVRQMLGLADRARTVDLFEALMRGDIAAALKELREQYEIGADPAVVLTDLADFTHFVTRVKVVPAVAEDISLSEVERTRGRAFATQLSMRVLSRTWQMLLKGLADLKDAARPLSAAEMVLVRIAYAADLPTPDEVMRSLGEEQGSGHDRPQGNGGAGSPGATNAMAPRYETSRGASPRAATAPAAAPLGDPVARLSEAAAPALTISSFEDLIALAAEKRDLSIKMALERDVRLVRFEDGQLEISLQPSAAKTLVGDLSRKLTAWTGRRWMIAVSSEQGAPTVRSQMEAEKAELLRGVRADPLVQSVLARFPGAEIVDVRRPGAEGNVPEALPADLPSDHEHED
ncbi:MAG: polymerase subunit gamma/tau [Alphaproteobacteria bacterium]|jgi:DNA polymerase-3 subunit gamma/tau|nr:polymerase subunit gamma/tau [Alphaproteobacteria bacterium]